MKNRDEKDSKRVRIGSKSKTPNPTRSSLMKSNDTHTCTHGPVQLEERRQRRLRIESRTKGMVVDNITEIEEMKERLREKPRGVKKSPETLTE